MSGELQAPLNQEGFLCPICVKDLGSAAALSEHFNVAHSEEDSSDVLDQVKGFFGKAKKFFNFDQDGLVDVTSRDSQHEEHGSRQRSSSTRAVHSYYLEPQQFGKVRKHTDYFKAIRDAAVDRSVIEGNKIIIRLSKLTSDEAPEDGPKRKAFEQRIVPWEDDKSAKVCCTCGKSFNISRRRHHCRLCGCIMCDQCSEFLPISQAKLLGMSASSESGLVIGKTQPTFLRRRGSNSSLNSLGSQETGPALRMCRKCRKLLESHRKKQEEKFVKPEIVALYERIQECKAQSELISPDYSKMALSLRAGETIYSLSKASELHNKIAKLYSIMEGTSKRIVNLKPADDEKAPTDRQIRLQTSIRAYTVSYIQERSLQLPKLPNDDELKALITQREQQRKLKVEELKQSQQREHIQQQTLQNRASPPPSATVKHQLSVPVPSAPTHSKLATNVGPSEGWKPSSADSKAVEDSDPMVQQMNIIRGYLKQAKQVQKWDEVEMLEENLRTLEEEYYNNCDSKT